MRTLIILNIVVLTTVSCTPQNRDLGQLINNIFKKPTAGCGVGKECVPHYLCRNSRVVTDGTGVIDIRFDGEQCGNYLEVCCSVDKKVTDPTIHPKPTPEFVGSDVQQPGGGGTTGPTPSLNNTNNDVDIRPHVTGCGVGEECVPHYLCSNSRVVKDGTGIIDIRFDGNTPVQCANYLEECCSVDKKVTDPIIIPKPTPDGCGYRNIDGVGFKITGAKHNETQYGEFPWMIIILKEETAGNEILSIYQCGGSLIHPRVVLTGAHCVHGKPANILKIRAGEWDTQTQTELFPHQDRTVAEVITHPHFGTGNLFNDIALLVLTSPVELADNVKTVCLPPANTNFDYNRCFLTGWGKDRFGKEGKYQVILKKIDLPIVPRDQCQLALRGTRLGRYFELHRSFICAGGESGKGSCKGDGGSPLVCPIGNTERYMQAGIIAWRIGCNEPHPDVYASVAELRPWLDEQLAYLNIESSYFTA